MRVDGEIENNLFGEIIKPDLQVISNSDSEKISLYIIEVKKMINRKSQDN